MNRAYFTILILIILFSSCSQKTKESEATNKVVDYQEKSASVLSETIQKKYASEVVDWKYYQEVNDEGIAQEVRTYLKAIAPEKEAALKVHRSDDLFDKFQIYKQIKASFGKQVNLKSGA